MVRHLPNLALALVLTVLVGTGAAASQIKVGGKHVTGQRLLAEITTQYLEARGYDVTKRDGMASTVVRRAQRKGQVDLYWEDVGTALLVHNTVEGGAKMSAEAAYQKVKTLDAAKDLVWLEPTDAHATHALAMRATHAEKNGIASLSQLVAMQRTTGGLRLGVTSAWAGRPDGLAAFQARHDIRWPREQIQRMPTHRIHRALKNGEIDVGVIRATDGRIAALDLRVLADHKAAAADHAIAPVVRRDVLNAHPALRKHLTKIGETLDDDTMRRLSTLVDVEGATVAEVAEKHLDARGLM